MALVFALLACSDYGVTKHLDAPRATLEDTAAAGVPDIDVAPRAADFGTVARGASVPGFLTVRNLGDAALTLADLAVDDTSGAFTLTALDSPVIPAGQSRSVAVTFTPLRAGRSTATVTFTSDDPDEPSVAVPLVGGTLSPELALDPGLHEFGTLGPLEEATATIQLVNAGDGDLVIDALTYTASSAELTLRDATAAYGPLPWTLAPGEARAVEIDYAPRDETADEGRLAVASNEPHGPRFAAQTGNGTRPPPPEAGWFELFDDVLYETASSADHVVDHHGDPDLYWYEPSGVHGLVGSADPTADFAVLAEYLRQEGEVITPVAPIDVSDGSSAVTFAEATFTYWMCIFDVPAEDDPAAWAASVRFVDDGLLVLVNGVYIGDLQYTESAVWSLADVIRPGERNTFLAILVDDSSGQRIVTDLALTRDGLFVE